MTTCKSSMSKVTCDENSTGCTWDQTTSMCKNKSNRLMTGLLALIIGIITAVFIYALMKIRGGM